MIILTDVDGVLLNWKDPFIGWMLEKGYKLNPDRTHSHDMGSFFEGVSATEIRQNVIRFNSSASIGFLPALRDAQKYVNKIHEEFDVSFFAISSMGSGLCAKELRKINLEYYFGDAIKNLTILPLDANKTDILKLYSGNKSEDCIWIEDHIQNAVDGNALGIRTFLMNHDYNQCDDSLNEICYTRINNWKDIYDYVSNKTK